MKKKIYLLTTVLSATTLLFLSSCLKDKSHDLEFGNSGTWVNFPKGGATNFGGQAITAGDTSTRVFAVNIASPELISTSTAVTFKVGDQATVDKYNASQSAIQYVLMPTNAYKIYATSVTIPAKQLYAYDSVTVYKNLLDPAKSYMLPITIASTTNGKLTTNLNTLLYHVIGNDFAGTYREKYQRYNASDSVSAALNGASFDFPDGVTTVFQPVTPTEFTVYSGYVSGAEFRYDVTFTKTGSGTAAMYTNFHVAFIASDVTAQQPSITVASSPVFFDPATHKPGSADLPGPYTFAQAETIFHFQWEPMTSATRYILDTYIK